jgi:hypothetical protein
MLDWSPVLADYSGSAIAPRWRVQLPVLKWATTQTSFKKRLPCLAVNIYKLNFDDTSAYEFLISLFERGAFSVREIEPWLRNHVHRI